MMPRLEGSHGWVCDGSHESEVWFERSSESARNEARSPVASVPLRSSLRSLRFKIFYFSRATTKSGAHSRARLISELGKVQMALRAASAYSAARALAASRAP